MLYISNMSNTFEIQGKGPIAIERDEHGIPHIHAEHESDLYRGLGFCHAMDRGMPIALMRIAALGRMSELLDSNEEMLGIDQFFRRMNWIAGTESEAQKLTPQSFENCLAYCSGINERLRVSPPAEFKLLGIKLEEWKLEHTFMLSRLVGYLTMVQGQADIERLFVEMSKAGTPRELLEELFPGLLEGYDESLVKKIELHEQVVPDGIRWNSPIPRMMASNNWVVSGSRTESGKPILCNDPHLEINRLPNVWYEVVMNLKQASGSRYIMGATMPGIPGVLLGRTNDISWGVTYTFMDAVDSWIEKCKDGKFLRVEDGKEIWKPFHVRTETILRKKKLPVTVSYYENDHGLLDGHPNESAETLRLTTKWCSSGTGAPSLESMFGMLHAKNVETGMNSIGKLELSFNWVLCDQAGNIGYQMSGLAPKRRKGISGFVPLPGWDPANDWQGIHSHDELPRIMNPEEGFIVTANQDLNHLTPKNSTAWPINMPMGPERAQRITKLLSEKRKLSIEDCKKMHYDVYSIHAETFMKVIKPILIQSSHSYARVLLDWDFRYDVDSKGAALFEVFHRTLLSKVFGFRGMGEDVADHLYEHTGIFMDFHTNFDRIVLAEESRWFGNKTRTEIFTTVLMRAFEKWDGKAWGAGQQLILKNMLLGGKLPRFLGVDRGPITLPGGRATISQGQIYMNGDRQTSFAPSIRFITDLSDDAMHTNLIGGPSDRFWSKLYANDVDNWVKGKYKILRAPLKPVDAQAAKGANYTNAIK